MLEELAMSTSENAGQTAKLIAGRKFDKVYIVSKASHFKVALGYFRGYEAFKNAGTIDCGITEEEIIRDMEAFYKATGSKRVKKRLEYLRKGVRGTD